MQSAWRNRHLGNAALGAGLAYATSRYNSNANKFIAKNVKKYSKPTRKRKPTRARGSGGYRKRSFRGGRSKKASNIKMPAFGSKASSNIMKGRASKINKKYIKLESSKFTNQIITPVQYLSTQGNQNNTVDGYFGYGANNDLATQMALAGHFYNNTSGADVQDVPVANYMGQKFLLETLKRTTTYTNQSPVKVTMCIYDLVAKQNCNNSTTNPATLWGNGLTDDAGTGSGSLNVPDEDPRASKVFNLFWKVSKKTRVVLEPGREFVHVFGKTFNKLIDYEWINNFSILQGITMVQMIVLYGGLVDDNPLATGTSNVTLAPAKVVAMQRTFYSIRQVTVFPRKQASSSSMVTTHANAFWAQDEGTDAPVTVISNTGAGVNYA